jgi:hypothetical protein
MRRTSHVGLWGWFLLAPIFLLIGQATGFAEDWTCPYCGRTYQFDPREGDYRSQMISLHLSVCGGRISGSLQRKSGPSKKDLELKDLKEASDDAVDKGNEFFKNKAWGQAIANYKEALDYSPENDDAKDNLQRAQSKADEAQKALAALEEARKNRADAIMREAGETARRLQEERRVRARQLQADLDNVTIPPRLAKSEVSLSWEKLKLGKDGDETMLRMADGAVFAWDLTGTIGGKALPACKILLATGKVFIDGEDGAYVHLVKQENVYEGALQYLRNTATAEEFTGIVRALRNGRAPESTDAGMLRAARAILDPALGNSGTQIAWDAMLSPEAKAAMVRKACIELGMELVSHGAEGSLSDFTRQKQAYDAIRVNREEARRMLKAATDPLDRIQLNEVIAHANRLLEQTYRLQEDSVKVLVRVETEPIKAAFEQHREGQQ